MYITAEFVTFHEITKVIIRALGKAHATSIRDILMIDSKLKLHRKSAKSINCFSKFKNENIQHLIVYNRYSNISLTHIFHYGIYMKYRLYLFLITQST